MKNLSIPPKISLPVGIVLIIIGLIARSILNEIIEVTPWFIILLGFILVVIGFVGLRTVLKPNIRLTAIIILISAAIMWIIGFFALGFFPFSRYGLSMTAIWFLPLIWAGLLSLRKLAWAFILMGVFFLFVFPLAFSGIDITPTSFVYLILICVGINFAFGLLSAIISFSKGKKTLTTAEKEKYN